MRIGSLFTGYGGLDMAVEEVFAATTAWVSDIKPAACKLQAFRRPDVPNLGDITAIDWDSVEPVDIITGGFPCTDISAAGKQAGLIRHGDGKTRSGLWSEMCHAIAILRPALVVAENVRTITSVRADSDVEPCPWCMGDDDATPDLRALGAVLADLADIGYDAAWCGLRASDVGAPHGRFRVFILAWPAAGHSDHQPGSHQRSGRPAGAPGQRRARSGDRCVVAADAEGSRFQGSGSESEGCGPERGGGVARGSDAAVGGGEVAADSDDDGRSRERRERPDARDADGRGGAGAAWGAYEPAIRRWEAVTGHPVPRPTEPGPRGGERLSPALSEWMMGLSPGHIVDVPGLSYAEMLSLAGDGVVPQQAEAALRWLLGQLGEGLSVVAGSGHGGASRSVVSG